MRQRIRIVLALAAALLLPTLAHAQATGGTQVAQQSAHYDAATNVQHSHTSAATITIAPSGNQFVYITGIDITNCAGTTVTAAAPLFITTGGLNGAPQYMVGTSGTAGMCNPATMINLAPGALRSQTAGTNVTFVLPTFTANQTVSINVYFYLSQSQ